MRDSKDFVVDGTTESAEFSNPSNYSDGAFWAKVKHFAKKAGAKVIYYALLLYYAHASLETPAWARIVILGALAYFICPFDLTPDIVPIVGFLDDLAILVAALKAVQVCITPEVKSDAKSKLGDWFGDVDEAELA
jgi:uncharacterized membrane protein YkvA (DUF1232 family)